MNRRFNWPAAAGVIVALATICGAQTDPAEPPATQTQPAEKPTFFSSETSAREEALLRYLDLYDAAARQLKTALDRAADKNKADRKYLSPLYCAIAAVKKWQVADCDETLLAVVDYQLDIGSFPAEMQIGAYDLFPAADALVRVQVDTRRVIQEIQLAKSPRALRMLTAVLHRRMGQDAAAAKAALEKAASESNEKANLAQAVKLLDAPDELWAETTERKPRK